MAAVRPDRVRIFPFQRFEDCLAASYVTVNGIKQQGDTILITDDLQGSPKISLHLDIDPTSARSAYEIHGGVDLRIYGKSSKSRSQQLLYQRETDSHIDEVLPLCSFPCREALLAYKVQVMLVASSRALGGPVTVAARCFRFSRGTESPHLLPLWATEQELAEKVHGASWGLPRDTDLDVDIQEAVVCVSKRYEDLLTGSGVGTEYEKQVSQAVLEALVTDLLLVYGAYSQPPEEGKLSGMAMKLSESLQIPKSQLQHPTAEVLSRLRGAVHRLFEFRGGRQ